MTLPHPISRFVLCLLISAVISSVTLTRPAGAAQRNSQLVSNPTSLTFGSIQDGSTEALSVTLTNERSQNLTLESDTVSGAGFTLEGLTTPLTLSPGQSYTFKIAFSPETAGAVSGSFQAFNRRDNPLITIPLSGTGTASGVLSLSPASASFGDVNVGSKSSTTGTLTASGASVTVTSASSSSSEFVLSGISLPTTLAAGQSASYTVTFDPASSGTASATLAFASNATDSVSESLSGIGVAVAQPAPAYTVNLAWDASTSSVTGYNIYRGTASGGPYSKLNSTLNSGTTYIDSTVAASSTYYYMTTALNSSGQESGYSNQVEVVIP
jgi:Abnormal spindle-like microcephaly-assoc'd, ASPM-SPD-2-Hydin